MALQTFAITNDGQFLLVTSTGTGDVESHYLDSIKNITYEFIAGIPGTYAYTDMKIITIEFMKETSLVFDLESVTNQAGWTLDQAGCIQAELDIRGWVAAAVGAGLATEATQLLVEGNTSSVATGLTSSKTTGAGNIPAGSKAASVVIDGNGGQINGVIRPNGWNHTFEFNNDTLPLIPYNGNTTATVYVDILT